MNNANPGIHISFGNGHGFEIRADNMDQAKAKTISRAKKDGFYNLDDYWSANIIELTANGQRRTIKNWEDWASKNAWDVVIPLTDTPRIIEPNYW